MVEGYSNGSGLLLLQHIPPWVGKNFKILAPGLAFSRNFSSTLPPASCRWKRVSSMQGSWICEVEEDFNRFCWVSLPLKTCLSPPSSLAIQLHRPFLPYISNCKHCTALQKAYQNKRLYHQHQEPQMDSTINVWAWTWPLEK